jgi:hypothetical protein
MGLNTFMKDGREVPDTWNAVYAFEKHDRVVTFECGMNSGEFPQPPEFRGKDALLRFSEDSLHRSFDVYPERRSAKYAPRIAAKEIKAGEPIQSFDKTAVPDQPSHMQDFFNCVRNRKKPKCNEDEAFIETVTFLMSLAAYRQKREVRWDGERVGSDGMSRLSYEASLIHRDMGASNRTSMATGVLVVDFELFLSG